MKSRTGILLFLFVIACMMHVISSHSQTIQLKNGETIEGEIVQSDTTHTTVHVKYGDISLQNEDIATISASTKPKSESPVDPLAATFIHQPKPANSELSPRSRGPVLFTPSDTITLEEVEKRAVLYFWEQSNPNNGLVKDRSRQGAPCSIAASGFGLAVLCIGAERGWLDTQAVRKRIETMLTFFNERVGQQRGFFYHFLNMNSGQREWSSEISSIDNAWLMAGVLFASEYYKGTVLEKRANMIFDRVDWPWMLNGGSTFCLQWKPEGGFSPGRWDTYAEHPLLYLMAMGAPSHPIPKSCWRAWSRKPKAYSGHRYIHNPQESLFVYLFSHAWIDFRGKKDSGINYWTNSVQAIKANRDFTLSQKKIFKTYEKNIWGLTETDGPLGYKHYGAVPNGHDGTIAPYAMLSSINFVPALSTDSLQALIKKYASQIWGPYGFTSGFNRDRKWYSKEYVGIHQGLIALMLENYHSGFIWKKMMKNPVIREGLKRAKL